MISQDANRSSAVQDGPAPEKADAATPKIELPKGGGAIRGIGEKFAANPVTGTGAMSVPISTSSGRSGFDPQLSLSYDSGAGNGPFGFGWGLALPSITRKTSKGLPQYDDRGESDVFILSDAEDLVPVLAGNGQREPAATRTVAGVRYRVERYRPRVEGLFARIERWSSCSDAADVFWRSISRDNTTSWYGRTAESRVADPFDPSRIYSWLICQSHDDKGNVIVYGYKQEDSANIVLSQAHECNRTEQTRSAQRYLKRIRYGNRTPYFPVLAATALWPEPADDWMFEAVFDYGEHEAGAWPARPDPFSHYRAGFEIRTYRICRRVLMFHHFPDEADVGRDCLVRSTDFTYSDQAAPADARNPVYTFLRAVTQVGYSGAARRSLPPVEFAYTVPVVQETVEEVDPQSVENLPIGLDGGLYRWTDLHGEGVPGILTEQAGGWFYKRNLSPLSDRACFAPLEAVGLSPNTTLGGAELLDLAGDGLPDVVMLEGPAQGLYEHDEGDGWQPFRPFTSALNRNLHDPNLRFVDLDGDGIADVLITEDDAFVWHAGLGEKGFGPARRVAQAMDEEKGPRAVFADGTQSIYLADISGDGMADLVRIRNNEVCYWPNLGYGRFGAKVTMDGAPWFDSPGQFDHRRLRLADIDGSGTTDIIYLHGEGVRLYFNQSGNGWSMPHTLKVFPRIDEVVNITPIDLLGNGTACLVWSSPLPGDAGRPMSYVNLMGGAKPHLLARSVNNLGAETQVAYAPSTRFYLQDKRAGRPWIRRLPFPVHVVERVITIDHVSRNRFVTRYAYHHGHFDGEEREFRGFGMVEQWDTEQIAALGDASVAADAHVPPVHTRSWFHTGAARPFAHEYFGGAGLHDTALPAGLTPEEEREACRALKGSLLRQEVYADDAGHAGATDADIARAATPYTVTEQNFAIRTLQRRGGNRHAVFFVHAGQSLSCHYERNLADPRTTHTLTLEVDDYGNVLKEAAVAYGRRVSPLAEQWDRDCQTRALLTLTESRVTNAIDAPDTHRTPLPCEAITYELSGHAATGAGGRYQAADLTQPGGRVLIEWLRTLYRADALDGLLPLGQLQPLALPGESYQLAFTADLLGQVFQRPRPGGASEPLLPDPAPVLGEEGGYVHFDEHWWIPSGQSFYSAHPDDGAAAELAQARRHFFLPRRFRDPFGQCTFVDYDVHDLLMQETRDALGNRTTVHANDYRVLQPRLASDPNGNRTAAVFDALGMVVGTALMGKPAPAPVEGDSLTGFVADLPQEQLDQFFDDPGADIALALLKDASTRIVHDFDRFRRTRDAHPGQPDKWQPACAATLVRETHASAPLPPHGLKIQLSISYSDGFGREIQRKIRAEPGPVPARDSGGRIVTGADGEPLMRAHDASGRWVGSGWTVYNNKGKPVREFEPFFTDTHRYEFDVRIGVSPVLFYDPAERVIAVLHPNHSYEKLVFDAWEQTAFDVNDTCTGDPRTDPHIGGIVAAYFQARDARWQTWYAQRIGGASGTAEQEAAQRAAAHADTPTTAHLDALGRPFLTVTRNRVACPGHALDGSAQSISTRVELDIEGKQRSVRDALGRVVMRYAYDMRGQRLYQLSMEAGARWSLTDVAGQAIRAWDSRGHNFASRYDALRRPAERSVRGTSALSDPHTQGRDVLVDRFDYGESLANAEALNLRGRLYRHFDSAGIVTNAGLGASGEPAEACDFKGNQLRSTRRLVRDYRTVPDWRQQPELEEEWFESSTRYDALNRPMQSIAPHSSLGRGKLHVLQPVFNESNLLERVDVWLERGAAPDGLLDPGDEPASPVGVAHIAYDARGQRLQVEYKNGASTSFGYDPLTLRLARMVTSRRAADFPGDDPHPAMPGWPGRQVQNLHYTYDAVGNITHIQDQAQQAVYFRNQRVEPGNEYVYDALYRLIEATGREHLGQGSAGLVSADAGGRFAPGDGLAMAGYVERYLYDAVGNILQLQHRGSGPARAGFTRSYAYGEPSLTEATLPTTSNRLTGTTLHPAHGTAQPEHYLYDDNGNMLRMPHLGGGADGPNMHWDYQDQLRSADLGGGGTAYYVYDATGQRVRKVWEKGPGRVEERIYLGGVEIFRRHAGAIGGSAAFERETLHVMDDRRRIALVETRTRDTADSDQASRQLIRYQFDNHLGSGCLELDEQARLIAYEEYAPYGSTTYQAVRSQTEAARRYRFTGKERDEESGLYYHGERYYAPWLGRWTACDPAGLEDSTNLYQYCFGNPTGAVDPDGRSGKKLAIVMHNESRPAGKELPEPKAPVKPTKQAVKAPGKKATADEKAKYTKEKSKADKAFAASMKKYEGEKKQYESDLKKYKENKKLWSTYNRSHNEYDASEAALKKEGYDVVTVASGKELLEALKNAGSIKELVVLSHGNPFGLGGEGPGAGIYTQDPAPGSTFDTKRASRLSDMEKMIKDKKIVFEKDATIVLGMCRTAGGKEGSHVGASTWTKPIEDTFAYRLAAVTGREVIGSEGVTSYGADQRKSTPMRFSAVRWHRFTQQGNTVKADDLAGKYLNVVTRKTSTTWK